MAKHVISKNSMFVVYTDTERQKEQSKWQKEYSKAKNIPTRETVIKIVKKPYGYVGIEVKGGFLYPLKDIVKKNIIKNPKQGQKYKVLLNTYEQIISAERI